MQVWSIVTVRLYDPRSIALPYQADQLHPEARRQPSGEHHQLKMLPTLQHH